MQIPRSLTYQQALALGATDWEMRNRPWIKPLRGIAREVEADGDPAVRIGDAVALMSPGDVLTGWAARIATASR